MRVALLAGPHAVVGAHLASALECGASSVLATLVARTGHAYRAPGAHLWVSADTVAGSLSAGCVEEEVAAHARRLLAFETAVGTLIDVDTDGEGVDGLGSGCGAVLRVALETVDPAGVDASAWTAWAQALRDGAPARRWMRRHGDDRVTTVAWSTSAGAVRSSAPDADDTLSTWTSASVPLEPAPWEVHARIRPSREGWIETVPRPPRATIVGTGPDAQAVARTVARMGWRVRMMGRNRHALDRCVDDASSVAEPAPWTLTVDAPTVERWLTPANEVEIGDPAAPTHAPTSAPTSAQTIPPEIEPQDVVLAASHDLEVDPAVVAWAVARGAGYVGVVGSRRRVERVLRRARDVMTEAHVPRIRIADLARVDGPAGWDVGARGPWEVATSVAARWTSDLRARSAPVWAVVPAAGWARRLGVHKPLVHKDGTTLIRRAVDLAEVTCDGTVVVVRGDAEAVVAEVGLGAHCVHVGEDVQGFRRSLAHGLSEVPAGARVLVLLPDMPGVDVRHLLAMRRAAASEGRGAPGVVTCYPDGVVGAPAIVPIDVVEALLAGGVATGSAAPPSSLDAGLRGEWMEREGVVRVPLEDASDLDDLASVMGAGWSVEGVAATP